MSGDPGAALSLAQARLAAQDPAGALEALRAGKAAGPLARLIGGMAHLQNNDLEAALVELTAAAAALPSHPAAWRGLVELHSRRKAWPELCAAAAEALRLEPRDAAMWRELAMAQLYNNDAEAAVVSLSRALTLRPQDLALRWLDARLLPILYRRSADLPRWRARYLGRLQALARVLPAQPEAAAALLEASWDAFHLHYQALPLVEEQRALGALLVRLGAIAQPLPPPAPRPGPRRRIGFASTLWRDHTVSMLFGGWVRDLDRARFEVVLIQLSDSRDAQSAELEAAADEVLLLPGAPTAATAAAVHALGLHALIFPELGMDRRLLRLAARRLAPLQLVSWGHPVTTGLSTVDGFLSSDAMERPDAQADYTERLVRLPGLGAAPRLPPPEAHRFSRADLGLGDEHVILLVPQSPFKLLPAEDRLLARVTRAVRDAGRPVQLVLLASEAAQASRGVKDTLIARLAEAFAAEGLQITDHLRLLPHLGPAAYQALNAHADVFLDAPGWSGGRTTLEALQQGLVPVTRPGPLMRQRHTAAILRALDCTETIAEDDDQYVHIATRLALDLPYRQAIARGLQAGLPGLLADRRGLLALEALLGAEDPAADLRAPRAAPAPETIATPEGEDKPDPHTLLSRPLPRAHPVW